MSEESIFAALLFVDKGQRRLVTHFYRAEILDRTGICVASVVLPLLTLLGEFEERSTVKFNKSLADNRFHLAMTTFHVHHHSDRYTACNPVDGREGQIAETRHITRLAGSDKACGSEAECIAIVGVKV